MTKGQLEHELSNQINKFIKVNFGKGPEDVKTKISGDMIVARVMRFLMKAEKELCLADDDGAQLMRQLKLKMLDNRVPAIREMVEDITGYQIAGVQKDFDPLREEMVLVFIMDRDMESELENGGRKAI